MTMLHTLVDVVETGTAVIVALVFIGCCAVALTTGPRPKGDAKEPNELREWPD